MVVDSGGATAVDGVDATTQALLATLLNTAAVPADRFFFHWDLDIAEHSNICEKCGWDLLPPQCCARKRRG